MTTDREDISREENNHLPKSVIKQLFDAVRSVVPIPDVLKDDVQLKERQLRAAERRLQRRFIAQYKAQVSLLEPILHERGVAVGTAIRDALLGSDRRQADMTYTGVVYRTPGLQLVDSKVSEQTRETLKILDPLIEPVLSSFVGGVEAPLVESLNDIKTRLGAAWIVSATAVFAVGFFAGRLSKRNEM